MSSTIEYDTADFFQVGKKGGSGWAEDRENGASIFLRLGEGARIDLVANILDAWLDEEDLNRGMAAGALRHAWDSEPYTGGVRVGSYVTSAVARLRDGDAFSMDEFIEEWGASLMSEAEERELKAMDFPLTVYRGGTGTVEEVSTGISWTLKPESLTHNSAASFRAVKRVDLLMDAMSVQASADAMDFSQSFARRRHRPSHAKVRSTTHRRVMTTKPFTAWGRRTISMVGPSNAATACRSLFPA